MQNDIQSVFGRDARRVLERIAQAAAEFGCDAYLVGGPVRDLLLGLPLVDLDIMIEGDAPSFAKALFERWQAYFDVEPSPGKPIIFKKFHTAKLPFKEPLLPGVSVVDFSTARTEHYPAPGAQPVVSPGRAEEDLSRRDFSINAMAIGLCGVHRGMLLDRFDGRAALEARLLEVLHERSFEDDPARLLRAVRFMVRFTLALEPKTAELFSAAVAGRYLDSLPAFRRFDEMRKCLAERQASAIISALEQRGILQQLHPRASAEALARSEAAGSDAVWEERLAALFSALSDEEFAEMLGGFEVKGKQIEHLLRSRSGHAY